MIGTLKEALKLEQGEKVIDNKNLTPETLLEEGKVTRTVKLAENKKYYMYYALKENAYEGMQGLGKGNLSSLKDVFLIDDNLNIKYIANDGTEYGDNLIEKILEDTTEIKFANKEFREYILTISGSTEGKIFFMWMKNLTKLEITDSSITSLQDLVFFPNLKELSLQNLTLDNLEGISNCTKLEYYKVGNSNIKDNSEISKLVNLKTYLDYNNIKEENIKCLKDLKLEIIRLYKYNDSKTDVLSKIKTLKTLELSDTEITEIDNFSELINLETLSINNSKINSLKGIEKLKKLKIVNFIDNNIYDITELANNENLQKVNLKGNSQISADKSQYTGERLEKLNKLSDMIKNGCIIYLDVDKLKLFNVYKELDLSSQNLTTLDAIEGMTELENLDLSYNQITLKDKKSREILSNMQKLKSLTMVGNPIVDIKPINNLQSLESLTLKKSNNINLQDIEDIISNIRLDVMNWDTLTNCTPSKITRLHSTWSDINSIPNLSIFDKLEEIKFQNVNIIQKESIKNISAVKNLKNLTLESCKLQEIPLDFSNLQTIQQIDLSGNYISSKELNKLEVLKNIKNLNINLSENSIIDASSLLVLDKTTKINLAENTNLTKESKAKLQEHFKNITF